MRLSFLFQSRSSGRGGEWATIVLAALAIYVAAIIAGCQSPPASDTGGDDAAKLFADAEKLADDGQWHPAALRYARVLELQPDHDAARQGLNKANDFLAIEQHAYGLQFADAGDLQKAAAFMRAAALYRSGADKAQMALQSIGQLPADQPLPGQADYERGKQLASQKQFGEALAAFEAAVAANSYHLAARAERAAARKAAETSNQHVQEAEQAYKDRRLDVAAAAGRQALDAWPTNPAAMQLMQKVRADLDKAEAHYLAAQNHARAGEFDVALAAAEEAMKINAGDPKITQLDTVIRTAAASRLSSQANQLLADGDNRKAEQLFERAMQYKSDYPTARDGLGRVAFLRGLDAENRQQFGEALLWYLRAGAYHPDDGSYKTKITEMKGRVIDKIGLTVRLEPAQPGQATGIAANELTQRIASLLETGKPFYVTLITPQNAASAAAENQPTITVRLALERFTVDRRQTGSERKIQQHERTRRVPNPRISELMEQVRTIGEELATVKTSQDGQSLRARRAELQAEIASLPFFITQSYPAPWPYEIQTHAVVGESKLAVALMRGEEQAGAFAVDKRQEATDTTVINPSEELSIAADPLELPPDSTIRGQLMESTATEAAERIAQAVARAHAESFLAAARRHEAANEPHAAHEARVAAALILDAIDHEAARQIMIDLYRQVADPSQVQ